jgi:phosphate transport system substrate-binding protein
MSAIVTLAMVIIMSGCTQSDAIVVVGRDPASGTRGAFDELTLGDDAPTDAMEQMNSNQLVHDKVATTKLAIGYVGLGYLDEEVKPLEIDGVMPSKDTVLSLAYPIARDLNMFYDSTTVTADALAYINFLQSDLGQDLVAAEGFVDLPPASTWDWSNSTMAPVIDITIAGSTTVLPIATTAAAYYAGNVTGSTIAVEGGGSSTGVSKVGDGLVDIGMASRELKSTEVTGYPDLVKNVVAKDGIALIVHPDNDVTGMSKDMVKLIYVGNVTKWSEAKDDEDTTTESGPIGSFAWLIALFEEL